MQKFKQYFREFLRRWFGLDLPRSGSHSQLWHASRRFAQSPSIPARRQSAPPDGRYAGSSPNPKWRKYSPDEVKRILRGLERSDRARPVMLQAAMFNSLLDERMRRYFPGRERIFDRLGYVLQQYTLGLPCHDIARSVSYFSDGQDVEDAIDFAARLIAREVNRQRW